MIAYEDLKLCHMGVDAPRIIVPYRRMRMDAPLVTGGYTPPSTPHHTAHTEILSVC